MCGEFSFFGKFDTHLPLRGGLRNDVYLSRERAPLFSRSKASIMSDSLMRSERHFTLISDTLHLRFDMRNSMRGRQAARAAKVTKR
jgi:hypothetical protein